MHQIELALDFNSVNPSGRTVIFFALFMTPLHSAIQCHRESPMKNAQLLMLMLTNYLTLQLLGLWHPAIDLEENTSIVRVTRSCADARSGMRCRESHFHSLHHFRSPILQEGPFVKEQSAPLFVEGRRQNTNSLHVENISIMYQISSLAGLIAK